MPDIVEALERPIHKLDKGAFRFQSTTKTSVCVRRVDLDLKWQRFYSGFLAGRLRTFAWP
jgi:hypothetical protein